MANTARNKPGSIPNTGITEVQDDGTQALRNVQDGFQKNQKWIFGVLTALILIVGGWFAYKNYVQKPNDEKALNALFRTQQWFEADSMNLVLNGDGQNPGALAVIKKYSGSKAANLAEYYAGIAFLKTGKPEEAIRHLEKFNGDGTVFQYIAYGSIGSAYLDLNKPEKAIEYYKKAASGNEDDNFTTPYYLSKAAFAYEKLGKNDEAVKIYKDIVGKYPASPVVNDVQRYLGKLGIASDQ